MCDECIATADPACCDYHPVARESQCAGTHTHTCTETKCAREPTTQLLVRELQFSDVTVYCVDKGRLHALSKPIEYLTMNAQKSRKIIVASGMAVVIGIGVMTFALQPHPITPIAHAITPPAPVEQLPDATPAAVAPAAVAQVVDAPATPAHKDVTVTKLAVTRHLAKADSSAVVTHDPVTRVEPVKSATELTTPPTVSTNPTLAPTPAIDQTVVPSAQLATADSQITTDVKSEIAVDTLSKDVSIGVITTNGVVALSGSLTSQDAIDHVKEVVAKVKDVKSVDTSALILVNL